MKLLICFLIALMMLIFLSSKCGGKDNFSGSDCPRFDPDNQNNNLTLPTPPAQITSTKDCDAWVDYLDTGVLNIPGRGKEALSLLAAPYGPQVWSICTMDQIRNIEASVGAFGGAETGLGPFDIGVNFAVNSVKSNISKYTKDDLCRLAKVITTEPTNKCQAADWSNSYMARITPDTKSTLNQWLTNCK